MASSTRTAERSTMRWASRSASSGAWLEHARHANAMAAKLESKLRAIPGVEIVHARQANAVFVRLPAGVAEALWAKGWHFYDFAAVAATTERM